MIVAKTIICVMYNAINISDVTRSQLQSSGRKLGLKNLKKADKNTLACLVAKSLLDSGCMLRWCLASQETLQGMK